MPYVAAPSERVPRAELDTLRGGTPLSGLFPRAIPASLAQCPARRRAPSPKRVLCAASSLLCLPHEAARACCCCAAVQVPARKRTVVCNESVMSRRGPGSLRSNQPAGLLRARRAGNELSWAGWDETGKGGAAAALVQEHQRGCTRPRRRTTQRWHRPHLKERHAMISRM